MSLKQVRAFWSKVAFDPALQLRVRSIQSDDPATTFSALVAIGREYGFDFDAHEISHDFADGRPLTDETPDPADVAGGGVRIPGLGILRLPGRR